MNNQSKSTTSLQSRSDIVRNDGILRKGFGFVPNIFLLDPDLTVISKAIYAYFCSFCGGGTCEVPRADMIMQHLGVSRTSYYRHYYPLTHQGYIVVKREHADEEPRQTVYTLPSKPEKYFQEPGNPSLADTYTLVRERGLNADGYGVVPRLITTNENLSAVSKAIYALHSVCSNGDTAPPSKGMMMRCLDISKPTFNKYFAELVNREVLSEESVTD